MLYIELSKDIYVNASTCVKTQMGKTKDFSMKIGLHHASSLNPYLFSLVLDELTRNIQDDAPWCMLFSMAWC